MKFLLKINEKITLSSEGANFNRIAICKKGIKGFINRSGAIICNDEIAKKILEKSDEVSSLMSELFNSDFKELTHSVSNPLDNPANKKVRNIYFKH